MLSDFLSPNRVPSNFFTRLGDFLSLNHDFLKLECRYETQQFTPIEQIMRILANIFLNISKYFSNRLIHSRHLFTSDYLLLDVEIPLRIFNAKIPILNISDSVSKIENKIFQDRFRIIFTFKVSLIHFSKLG